MNEEVKAGVAQVDKTIELLLKAQHMGEDAQYLPGVFNFLLAVKAKMEEQIAAAGEEDGAE